MMTRSWGANEKLAGNRRVAADAAVLVGGVVLFGLVATAVLGSGLLDQLLCSA